MTTKKIIGLLVLIPAASVTAGSHTWRVNEIFSNGDGTIQYIELRECCGFSGETLLNTRDVITDVGGGSFTFTSNLPAGTDTAGKSILLATAGFAALPGAPTPDHIIADGFIVTGGDTVRYGPNPPANNYHTFTFGAGDLPTNGKDSVQVTNFATGAFTTGPNTPSNCAAQTGTVDACPHDCDGSSDGTVDIDDFLAVLAQWGQAGTSCHNAGGAAVGIDEFLDLLANWGSCP